VYGMPRLVPMTCEHMDFVANVEVDRLTEDEGGPMTAMAASISIACVECGAPMRFIGPMEVGVLPNAPTVNPLRDELRVPLTFDDAPEGFGRVPGVTMHVNLPGDPRAN
jgi:hypothetical protein